MVRAQDIPVNTEQQLEQLADLTESETEDDTWLVELEHFRKHPLNLNTADEEELPALNMLNALQVSNLVLYRKLFGMLVDIHELQAVPSWDLVTIRKMLPFVIVEIPLSIKTVAGNRLRDGEHSLILRISRTLEKSKGYYPGSNGKAYPGSRDRIFFRYRYNYKNLLQFGIVGDKDAGEGFFGGAQKTGFDFYSFHLFARKLGAMEAIALGDFTVNMGQGLIQWQSLSFKKSAEITGIKRQSAVLRPYHSAGEFNFNRGIGITVRKGRIETTVFASLRKLSANFSGDTASLTVSSLLPMGYHRTEAEIENRKKLRQLSFGSNITIRSNRFRLGLNAVSFDFSHALQKRDEPYNLFAFRGRTLQNFSVDYSYTYKNLHFFGEAATSRNLAKAFLNGVLISPDARVDISLVHRFIEPRYQAIYGNAFTENTQPANESGFFAGMELRPANGIRVIAYADMFRFPWLRYLADAPGRGREYLLQVIFQPNRQVEVYTRYRNESKPRPSGDPDAVTRAPVLIPRKGWRMHLSCQLTPALAFRSRVEVVWYNNKGIGASQGSLFFSDLVFKPRMKPYSGSLRVEYFETDDYDTRIYAYEQDVAYSFSIPALSGKGHRYYLLLNYDLSPRWSAWFRISQTIYRNQATIGTGDDEIRGNRKTECRLQLRWLIPPK